jgi:hypothetical protein
MVQILKRHALLFAVQQKLIVYHTATESRSYDQLKIRHRPTYDEIEQNGHKSVDGGF